MGAVFPAQHVALSTGRPSASLSFRPPSLPLPPRQLCHRASTSGVGAGIARASVRSVATFYDILELSPDVGLSDIKKAYRQLARRYHPDVCSSSRVEESTRRFIEIQEAYETLSDPRRRAVYDHAVAMGRGTAVQGRMPWSPSDKDCTPADWKTRWESQLSGFKRRSEVRARRTDTWAARMRMQSTDHES